MRFSYYIRYIGCLLSLLCCCVKVSAQFDARFSQYWAVPAYYHAAVVGQSEKLNIQGGYGMQLMEFERAPRVMYLGAELPFTLFHQQHGAGINFFNEVIGLFRNQRIWAQYAYQLRWKRARLGIGVQFGLLNVKFDPSNINLGEETEDPAFPTTEESGMGADLGVSLYYRHSQYYAALSAQHLTSPRIAIGEKSFLKVKSVIYLGGGYNIQTRNPLISMQPSIHLQTDGTSTRFDATVRAFYTWRGKVLSGTVGYSPDTSVTLGLGLQIRNVTVGYAYELFTSKIGAASGSHDLVVSYAIDMNVFKKSRNLHKSVRIL